MLECWNIGILDCWINEKFEIFISFTPLLQHSSTPYKYKILIHIYYQYFNPEEFMFITISDSYEEISAEDNSELIAESENTEEEDSPPSGESSEETESDEK